MDEGEKGRENIGKGDKEGRGGEERMEASEEK